MARARSTKRALEPTYDSPLVKRALHIATSGLVLFVLAPLLSLLSVALRIESAGPVLFRAERVGRNGRRFLLFRFRTMALDHPGPPEARLTRTGVSSGVRASTSSPR